MLSKHSTNFKSRNVPECVFKFIPRILATKRKMLSFPNLNWFIVTSTYLYLFSFLKLLVFDELWATSIEKRPFSNEVLHFRTAIGAAASPCHTKQMTKRSSDKLTRNHRLVSHHRCEKQKREHSNTTVVWMTVAWSRRKDGRTRFTFRAEVLHFVRKILHESSAFRAVQQCWTSRLGALCSLHQEWQLQ